MKTFLFGFFTVLLGVIFVLVMSSVFSGTSDQSYYAAIAYAVLFLSGVVAASAYSLIKAIKKDQ